MPKYVQTGADSTHPIRFVVPSSGELAVPSSASYSLKDNAGVVVEGIEDEEISLTDSSTSVVITIPGAANSSPMVSALRYLIVKYLIGSVEYTYTEHYMLRDTVMFPLSVVDVKIAMGALDIPDEYIDVLGAYDQVKIEATGVDLDNILTTGSVLLPHLVNAVKYKAAILSSGAFETAVMQSEQADNTLYKRFQKVDFASIKSNLLALYNMSLAQLTGNTEGGVTPNYAILSFGTDAVTGQ